jgi:hypothetical protein
MSVALSQLCRVPAGGKPIGAASSFSQSLPANKCGCIELTEALVRISLTKASFVHSRRKYSSPELLMKGSIHITAPRGFTTV